jgi:hypothetical protein
LALNATDIESWKITAIIMSIVSIVMFAVQRSSYMFLDIIFEICIFHVPALIAVGVYLYLRKRTTAPIMGVKSA